MSVTRKKVKARSPQKKHLELDLKQIDALLARAEAGTLQEGDHEIIKSMVKAIVFLSQTVDEKAAKIKKLLRMIFGATTEKMENVLPKAKDDTTFTNNTADPGDKEDNAGQPTTDKKKGHGRNGIDDYPGASRVKVGHPELKADAPCPECKDGKLYRLCEPGVEIRITGAAPLQATIYELEKLRCNLCGTLFTALLPEHAGKKKYDPSAVAMITLLKYGFGLPFNRIEGLQAGLGIPLPASSQWDIVNQAIPLLQPVYQELIHQGAQGELFFNDDTTMKVLELIKENQRGDPERTGMFTSGIVAVRGPHKIVLFFTGRKHAGENLATVLSQRRAGLPTPLQMCDALARNVPEAFKTILFNCMVHARRNFVDASVNFPDECGFVIEKLAKVYQHEKNSTENGMSTQQRLEYHQIHSGPIMEELHGWLNTQSDDKKVEPNSSLGGAINYMLKRWNRFTGFLRIPGAPLDNNTCERALKKAILHRKNSLFFKTEKGAAAGDMFLSLIHSCELNGSNPHDYLAALVDHAPLVQACPAEWMPWNYRASMIAAQ
jgi:transposase